MVKEGLAEQTYREFSEGTSYKRVINLEKDIERSVNFENGRQWNMDEDIKEYPKITLNIIKQITAARMSNIVQNEYSYLVNTDNARNIRKIQDFLKYLANVTQLKTKDIKAVKDDTIKGTAIGYFYWDAEKRGFMRKSGGELRYELVDVRNFVVANESIQNIQDQEYVIYVTRERLDSIKKKYKVEAKIHADDMSYTAKTDRESFSEKSEKAFVNVYTKFYRNEEGQVMFHISTRDTVLKKPTAMNPFYNGVKTKEEPNTMSVQDEKINDKRGDYVWNLYPFVSLTLNERDNCFYGLPITLEYIDAQKSINNHFAVYDKALQDNVLGGWVYREGALDSNEITTENGQLIGLKTMPNEPLNNALARLPVANVPSDSHHYATNLIRAAREVAGASNVQLGMADYAGQSGKQTQMLIQRAQMNATESAMFFNQFKQEQAYIMFLFAKFYYDNESFAIVEHGFRKDNIRSYDGDDVFDGTEYLDEEVFIDIKVGSGAAFSEYTNIEMLGLMVQSGQLPAEAYISMLPDGYISNKEELLEMLSNNSQKVIKGLQEQMMQMKEVMDTMAKAYQETAKDRENINKVIAENDRLKSQMAELAATAIKRTSEADANTQQVMAEMQELLTRLNAQK